MQVRTEDRYQGFTRTVATVWNVSDARSFENALMRLTATRNGRILRRGIIAHVPQDPELCYRVGGIRRCSHVHADYLVEFPVSMHPLNPCHPISSKAPHGGLKRVGGCIESKIREIPIGCCLALFVDNSFKSVTLFFRYVEPLPLGELQDSP